MDGSIAPAVIGGTPTTAVFGDTAAAGSSASAAPSNHRHGMPTTWTKVAAGSIAAALSIDFAALSGFRRYRLMANTMIATPGTTNWQPTLKLNNSASHQGEAVKGSGGTVTGVTQSGVATVSLMNTGTNNPASQEFDILVTKDTSASGVTNFIATAWGLNGGAKEIRTTGGCDATSTATITEILLSFGLTMDTGQYVLYGSNEIT